VPTQWQYAARDVEPVTAQRSTLRAVCFEELATLVWRLDLAQLARRDVGIKDIKANVMHDATCETNIAGGGCTCNPTISVHPVPGDDSGKRHVLLDDDGKPIAPS
jgi:hypothetical protein